MTPTQARLHRSELAVPGSNLRMLEQIDARDEPAREEPRRARAATLTVHAPSADLSSLTRLLEDVLRMQAGADVLDVLAELHIAARGLRHDDEGAEPLQAAVAGVPSGQALPIVRACSMHLAMGNVADELRRLRLSRAADASELTRAGALIRAATRAGDRPTLDLRLVLTAHPTDISRRSVLSKHRTVSACMDQLDDPRLGSSERRRLEDETREALSIWYATNEVRAMRPRVGDEVRRLLYFFESVLFDAGADLARDFRDAVGELDAVVTPPLRFGSWAGGDMDGNPNVGPATINETLTAHRALALRMLIGRLGPLRREFSQAGFGAPQNPALRESLARDERELPRTTAELAARYPHEAQELLRRKLAYVTARLNATLAETLGRHAEEPGYGNAADLCADLELIRASVGSPAVMRGRLDRLIWQARVFGFHLATLEVRENAPELHEACRALLPGYAAARTEAERTARLTQACLNVESPDRGDGPDPKAAAVFDTIARAVSTLGHEALDTFIVSNCEQPSDILCALWLARRSGLFTPQRGPDPGYGRSSALELVPLFERRVALDRATRTMGELYGNAAYRQHLEARHRRQEVMLGYSDAGKDMGYLASQWSMYRTQERLARQAAERGIELRLFHGRGGSSSRGGGPAYRSILAQPPGTVGGRIKITEQGEVVSAKFSDGRLAAQSLQQTLAAVVQATIDPGPAATRTWLEEMNRIEGVARTTYQELVHDRPDLPELFAQCTPIDVLDLLNIGSRPASRGARRTVQSLRAIPWVFAWMQTRIGLTSWYGAGSGLCAGTLALQRQMYRRWPFFNGVVSTLESALTAVDLTIGRRYFALADASGPAAELWELVEAEHRRCVERVLAITGRERLMDPTPDALSRHAWRRPWLDVLSFLQIELLRRHRAGDAQAVEPLLATVAGIATGLRTTG
jgi:phosphoenolpyruvate carboxylase